MDPKAQGRAGNSASLATRRPDERWHVAQVQPRAEAVAEYHLRRQGFEVYVPRLRRTTRHARQFRTTLAALFPGYVFVQFDASAIRWRSVNGTHGVKGLLMSDDKPATIPTAVIDSIRSELGGSQLAAGSNIVVIAGPFAGLTGRLERLESAERVRVLLEILGGSVALSLHRTEVQAG